MAKGVITLTHHGSFNKTEKFLEHLKNAFKIGDLDKYGKMGVDLLEEATPKDTGLTSRSWTYEIVQDSGGFTIVWNNTNIQNGVNIAMILQYGHATRNGGYVEGLDYINPALREVFTKMQEQAQKEVSGVL